MRWRDDNAIGQTAATALVVHQDRLGNRRGWGEFATGRNHRLHAIGRQHFNRAVQRRLRQRMGIGTDKQRPADALGAAVITNRLTDRQHMRLIETVRQRAATMPGSTERDPLARNAKVRLQLKISGQQRRDISQ